MKKMIYIVLIFFTVFRLLQADPISTNYENRVFLVGDSIVAPYGRGQYPLASWGMFLPYYFSDKVVVLDRAISGASTKTYINLGQWDTTLNYMENGDYLLIQFGNNDEATTSAGYTETNGIYYYKKYTDPDYEFQTNLTRFITEAQAKGVTPILVTMPIRMTKYSSGEWHESH